MAIYTKGFTGQPNARVSGCSLFIGDKKMNTNKRTARIAGFLYLTYIVMSIIADLFGRFVFGEAPATVNNMMFHESQFRIGFVISLFSAVFFLMAAWFLYLLLKPVNRNLALLFFLLNLGGFAIWYISMFTLYTGLLLLSADYLKVFQADQLEALAMLFINLRKSAAIIAQIPYGLWLFPLGYLVYKSGFLPKILGILLIADGVGLMIYVCQFFLLPGYKAISIPLMALSFIAEFSLTLWLLIVGVKEQKPAVVDSEK